jgi:hypothetical protein
VAAVVKVAVAEAVQAARAALVRAPALAPEQVRELELEPALVRELAPELA